MLTETLELLRPHSGGRYVDGTLGGGGHAEAASKRLRPMGCCSASIVTRRRDATRARLARFAPRVHVVAARFDELGECLERLGWSGVDGILLDLGVSSFQLDDAERASPSRAPGLSTCAWIAARPRL
jgi:16S rRNA (cytosine1402-N4)-methyltransferase